MVSRRTGLACWASVRGIKVAAAIDTLNNVQMARDSGAGREETQETRGVEDTS
jgi:hypothetical protein